MAEKLTYRLGKWVASNPGATVLLIAIAFFAWYALGRADPPPASVSTPASVVAQVPAAPDPHIQACGPDMEERRANARAAFTKKNYREAYMLLDYCNGRIAAGSPADIELRKYAQAHAKAIDDAAAKIAKAEKARKKREGVSIGMSEQDALDSMWGRPNKINRTTGRWGVHEQWVYDGGYLYFENGTLTSIQN